ncbi:hypothetical protein NMD69_17180 (plasmid) [Edwardsiella tarda]|uniref:hypothetical protein n=1 Tax=Edwardsiella TaxID=635 RepID=UPI001F3C02C8|nr:MULTISPECIES: hypothetical protein [Edwardsiella]UJT80827.1 hypothetical protein L1P06_17750 [Edwardsiella piscicida]WKS83030.1 hypothetical protein NHU85_17150 [Edwardsiella tarda]
MNTWLVGFVVEIDGTEIMAYMLIQAESLELAEAASMLMGCTWWPACQKNDNGYRWIYSCGIIWFTSITLLDDGENSILRGLKFLDTWVIGGVPESPVIQDDYGNDWCDCRR